MIDVINQGCGNHNLVSPWLKCNAERPCSQTSFSSFIDLSKMYFWLSSLTEPLHVQPFSEKTTYIVCHRKMWTLVLFSVCSPTGLMAIEQVPIDPEVMVAVDWPVFLICEL